MKKLRLPILLLTILLAAATGAAQQQQPPFVYIYESEVALTQRRLISELTIRASRSFA